MRAHRLGQFFLLVGMAIVVVCPVGRGAEQGAPAAPPPAAARDPEYGREVPLPGLEDLACEDIYEIVAHTGIVRLNYEKSDRDVSDKTAGMTRSVYLERKAPDGSVRSLLVGLTCYPTQDSRIYLWGVLTAPDGTTSANPDLDAMVGTVEEAIKARKEVPRGLSVQDLLYETYQLSNIDPKSCIEVLKALGYNTNPPGAKIDINKLPVVFEMPFKTTTTVVGRSTQKSATLPDETIVAPEMRLMIVYHPSQSVLVGNLKDLLKNTIDVPAEQVLIEGMVIELTEDDFKELGATWELFGEHWHATFLDEDLQRPFILTHDPSFSAPSGLMNEIRFKLRAIIEEGRGQILSSPSVLVLDNRNAKIQVVQDVPIFESLITERTTNFKVRFERVGIVLNIKPRISGDQSVVALQILVEVSEAPEEERIVVEGQSVAPIINRRVVETIARVSDNTPFIIGGLIRNEQAQSVDRLPVLSRIPILGRLFRRQSDRRGKREVIIVLTPRVIKTAGSNRPVLPKDSARFDFLNCRLFRNSYRLKADDIFDLGFLANNQTVLETMARARQFVHKYPKYADISPFKEMVAGVIPGEDAIVVRMLYEIAKDKLLLHQKIATDKIIVFAIDPQEPAGFGVEFLANGGRGILEQASPDGTVEGYFARPYPKKVLFLRYEMDPSGGLQAAMQAPAAKLEWVTVNSRDEVQQHLLDIDVLSPDYRYHEFAIALDTTKDLERLKACIALREIASVNNIEELLTLRNFQVGRKIVIPELDGGEERIFLADRTVAEFFYKSDYYYYALRQMLEQGYDIINEAIASEEGL